MKIVIALGGNALGQTPKEQKDNCVITSKYLVELIKEGHQIILTHGNGPQVGLINLAFTEGNKINKNVYDMPFTECGAMSEGYIGYHLQNSLYNELLKNGINKSVVSLVTQVEVDKSDKAFLNPTKPIGAFYTKEEAEKFNFPVKEDSGRGYRRVIASPKPVRILEEESINKLIESGSIVIACGGGGVPVYKDELEYKGIDAVIDKDFASSVLATNVGADMLLILTAVDAACINFNQPNEQKLSTISLDEAIKLNNEGHFKSGSMKPKVEACISFVQNTGNAACITNIENALNAVHNEAGTIIRK